MYDSKHDQRMISHMISAIKSRDHYMIVMRSVHAQFPSMGFSRQEYWSGLPLPSPLGALGAWYYLSSSAFEVAKPSPLL